MGSTSKYTSAGTADLLLQRLAKEVVDQLGKSSLSKASRPKDVEARLQKVERSLERLITGGMTGEEYETDETENGLPNLKYARPKYQNLESLLKYVEKDGDTVGVRLVIMNFND